MVIIEVLILTRCFFNSLSSSRMSSLRSSSLKIAINGDTAVQISGLTAGRSGGAERAVADAGQHHRLPRQRRREGDGLGTAQGRREGQRLAQARQPIRRIDDIIRGGDDQARSLGGKAKTEDRALVSVAAASRCPI